MKVLQTASLYSLHILERLVFLLIFSAAVATSAFAQKTVPEGLTRQHWNSIQDFWQYQARLVWVDKMDGERIEGLLLVAGEEELWVLPDAHWVLEQGEVLKIPVSDIKFIQLRKNPRIGRAALLGYLRTAIWSAPVAVAASDNELYSLSLLITLGIAAPMGLVFNTVYHGLAMVPFKNYQIYGKQDIYMQEAYPWISRYTLLAQPEEYLELDRGTLSQYPDTWNSLSEIIPQFKTLFAPNLVSLSFGYNFPIWSNRQQSSLTSYLNTVGLGTYEYYPWSSRGGFALGLTTEVAPQWSAGVRSTLGFRQDGSFMLNSGGFVSHHYQYDDVAAMVGYYIIPPNPYLKGISSLKAQVGLGGVRTNFEVADYDPITYEYFSQRNVQWSGALWLGFEYSIRAHRWLYFNIGAHSRLSTPTPLPDLELPRLGLGIGLQSTPFPIHQFQLTAQAAIMLHRPAKWAAQPKN